ncbi:MAG: glycosyltransferase family 2 protein [Vallitalea sp.]|nr:glycosyltransferase family 2 protein [Vallitalea sp.]
MISISLCMIVRDEEDVLERCLNSIHDIVDEIIIVDTGSIDRTKEIARKFSSKIFDYKWIDNFSSARNFSYSKATKDYILWLDADDIILEKDRMKLLELKKTLDNAIDVVSMNYDVGFKDNESSSITFRRYRLVKRKRDFEWSGHVHEYLNVEGIIYNSDISVTHKKLKPYTKRNLDIYENMIRNRIDFTPRDTFYYTTELYENGYEEEAIVRYKNFLVNQEDMLEEKITACAKLADYYYKKNQYEECKKYCTKSFLYDIPRAEFCCRLGFCLFFQKKFNDAIFWYDLATKIEKPSDSFGFFNDACWTWLPYVQLCKCYDLIGEEKLAYECNEKAYDYVKDNELVNNNKKYFMKLGYN